MYLTNEEVTVADTPGKNFCQIMRCILLITIKGLILTCSISNQSLARRPPVGTGSGP